MTPVLVMWDDAQTNAHMDWEQLRDCERLSAARVQTLGFLMHEDENGVELAMSYHESEICGRWYIPRSCIVSMRPLCHSEKVEWPESKVTPSPTNGK